MLVVRTNLDLNVDEELAIVDADDGADHLGDDGHVSQVGLDGGRLVVGSGSLLGLAQLLEQRVVSTGNAACETTTNAASQKLQKLLLALVQQSLELDAAEAARRRANEQGRYGKAEDFDGHKKIAISITGRPQRDHINAHPSMLKKSGVMTKYTNAQQRG
jgi:hypothetical protein